MTTTADVLPTIVIPQAPDDATGTLPEEWKMAGDSERRCVLSIVERDGLVHQGIRFYGCMGFHVFCSVHDDIIPGQNTWT
jgi:hypothetical protein